MHRCSGFVDVFTRDLEFRASQGQTTQPAGYGGLRRSMCQAPGRSVVPDRSQAE